MQNDPRLADVETPQPGRRKRSRRPVAAASTVALSILALAGAALGQSASGEPSSLFIDRVDVNIINVEVFVTDENGDRVKGLTVDDFEILEDGRPVEITNFYTAERADRAVSSFEQDRALVRGEAAPAEAAVPEDQRLSLAIYVDNRHIKPASRTQVLQELGTFIEDRVRQGDRVALLSHAFRVENVVPFTTDVVALARGVEKISDQAAYGLAAEAARRRVLRQMEYRIGDRALEGQEAGRGQDEIRNYIQQEQDQIQRSLNALDGVVRSLSGLPGRKALLYVSDSLPVRPGADLLEYYIDRFGSDASARFAPTTELLSVDMSDEFDELTRQANAGQVTLYTLHALGAKPRSSVSAANAPASLSNRGDSLADIVALDNTQEPLVEMAAATGGSAILNTSNFDGAFADLSQDFDSLYSLGYPSRTGGDGRYHKIEVRMKQPGLKARHRAGYVDKAEVDRIADRTYSSLILDMESNPLQIEVDFGEPEKLKRKQYHLPLLVRIPFDGITLLPNGDNHEGRLRIFLTVEDEEGGVSGLQEIPFPVSLPSADLEKAAGKEMGYAGKLLLRPGLVKVAVGVWDEVSGAETFVNKRVEIGKAKKKGRRGP